MGNFTRSLERRTALAQLQRALEVSEAAEAQAIFMCACLEAVHGPIAPEFLKEVQDLIKDTKPNTRGEFYRAVFGAAKTVQVDRELAAAQPSEAQSHSQGTELPSAPQSTLPASDISGT